MNSTKQRLMTLLLAFLMIITSLPLNVLAASGVSGDKKEITDIKTVGNKQIINLGNVRGEEPQSRFFSRSARLLRATNQQARSSSETVAQKVEINLNTMGLNLEEEKFDPSALTEVGSFDVEITFKELGGTRTETRTMTFQAGEIKKTETFYLPKDFGQGVVKAEIPKLKDNIALRVYVGANSTTNFNLGQDMTYKFELTQIIHPVIDLKVVDPYGKELQDNINQVLGLKLALEEEQGFNLPANTKTFNIRSLPAFAGDNVADLNSAGDNPELSLTTALDKDKKLKVGDKIYKLNKISYKALGQEVEINGQKKKVGGYIEFATQPKIVVPTPDENGDLPATPDGYKRLSFHAESSSNAQDGRFENGEKLKVIDVLEGTEYTDTDLQKQIKGIKQPTPLINGRVDDNKKFLKWKPELPTTGPVADTDFRPVYLADGGEITPGEKLPDGVFEVKVIKDNTIAADPLYGKSYGVFTGSKLARDKFPDLEAEKGHQNPKWTTEAEDPTKDMIDIAKPWTKVITKATTFKATAAEKAATQIKKEGLKAVDTTALQGQELTEEFWHKGVELADNTPAEKKDAFAALLKDATVTDKSSRNTDNAGTFEGKLLVTFKDGSILEVENQKLIVKPNTVTVAFDKAEGKEHPLRDGDTTVKGKISASSNTDKFPVNLDGALVTIKKGNEVLSRTLANADGSFVAGVKDPLVAGEDISVVVTLPESKTESAPVTEKVQLNPDKLNEIIETGNKVVGNLEGKKGVDQAKVATLKAAIKKATDDLVETNGKVKAGVKVNADGQKSLDTQYEAIKKAIEALTGNSAPEITGTSHKEIFKGDALNLEEGITVKDADGETDIVKDGEKVFTYTVEKVDAKGNKSLVTDTTTINQTAGTYKVTYTAKDKSGAEGTFVMTLVVKEPVVEIKDNFPEVIPEGYVKVEFKPGDHGTLDGTTKFLVKDGSAKTVLNAPTIKPNANYEAKKDANWKPAIPETFTGTEENNKSFTFTAQYTYIGKDVVEQKPGDKKPDVPDNFVKVEFKKGDHGVISSEETTIYWVNPEKEVTLTTPTVTPSHGYKHTGWDPEIKANTKYTEAKEFVAQYKATVVTEDPNDKEHYAKVEFLPGDQGTLEGTTTYWVWKGEEVTFNAPKVNAKENYKFKAWNPEIQKTYNEDKQHTATYESTQDVSDTEVAGYNKVTFKAGEHGTLTEKSVWVKPDTLVDLTDKAPKVTPAEGYSHIGWKPGLVGKFENNTEIVAQYSNNISDTPVEGWTELIFDQGDHGKLAKGVKNVKWVNPKAELKLKDIVPAIVADTNYSHDGWKDGETKVELETAQKFETAKTFTATYKSNVLTKEEHDKVTEEEKKNFVQITFNKGTNGKFPKEAATEVYVKKDVAVDLTEKAPTVIPNQGYGHSGWEPSLKGTFSTATTITAQYKAGTFDENAIKEIMVVGPTKMGYGVGEKLDLTGLKVIAKDDAGLQKTYDGVEAITKAGFTIAPANETELKMDDNGKHIVVTKGEGNDKVTGQTETTLTIHENKSAKAEDVKALNQNKVDPETKKVTDQPKDTTTVTGKVKPGSTVKITDEQGNDITPNDGVKVENDGTFTAEVTKQEVGKKVKVIVTEEGKQPSDPAEATVARDANNDGKADSDANQKTATPTAKALNVGKEPTATTITGKAEPNAKVVAKVGDTVVGEATADQDGNYTIQAKQNNKPLAEDTEVKVTAQADGKLVSDPTATVVKIDKDGNGIPDKEEQTERPAAIASNKGKAPTFTTIEGKTETGAVITVTLKDGTKVKVDGFKIDNDGNYTLQATVGDKPLENGAEILVYAQNATKKISNPQTTTVFNDFNKDGKPDGGKVDLTDVKDIQVIAPEKMSYTQGEKLNGTGLKAVVRDNKGAIEIFDYDNATGKFKDADGKAVADITATVANKPIKDLELTEKEHDGKAIDVKVGEKTGSTNQKLEVKQLQTPTPTIKFAANQNTVGSDGSTPTGTAKQKTTVKFTVKNKPTTVYVKYTVNGETKEESFYIGADDELTKAVDLQVKLPVGTEVKVLAKDADKTLSEAATAKVVRDANNDGTPDDKTPVGKATIDPIKAQSEKITVKPADNATELVIKETDKSGNTPADSKEITVKKDSNGNWTIDGKSVEKDGDKLVIPTKDKLKLDEYNVVEVESKGDPDTTTPSTAKEVVGQAADITAPDKPVVDQPVDGDKDIKVKTPTEPDAKTIIVEVEVPAKPGEDPTIKTVVVTKDKDGKWKTTDGKDVPEENGKLVIPVDPAVKTGDKVTVEVKDETGNPSKSDSQTVIERQQLPAPTINPIKINEKAVAGTAKDATTVDIYKKVGNDYKLIKEGVGVNSDGTYNYPGTTPFKDGDVIRVVAKKDGWTSNNAETTVGVDTTALDKAIKDGKDALVKTNDGTPEDKALEKAIKDAEDLKKRTDPKPPTQEELDNAQKEIEKAIENKKKTDEERQKLKDIIEEAEKETQKEGYKDKPGKDRRELEKVIKEGKENLKNNTNITESTTKIEKALEKIRKESIQVGLIDTKAGNQSITITTFPSYCKVKIYINDVYIEEIETDGFGSYRYTLDEPIKSDTTIELKAHKDGYNDGSYWTEVN